MANIYFTFLQGLEFRWLWFGAEGAYMTFPSIKLVDFES